MQEKTMPPVGPMTTKRLLSTLLGRFGSLGLFSTTELKNGHEHTGLQGEYKETDLLGTVLPLLPQLAGSLRWCCHQARLEPTNQKIDRLNHCMRNTRTRINRYFGSNFFCEASSS